MGMQVKLHVHSSTVHRPPFRLTLEFPWALSPCIELLYHNRTVSQSQLTIIIIRPIRSAIYSPQFNTLSREWSRLSACGCRPMDKLMYREFTRGRRQIMVEDHASTWYMAMHGHRAACSAHRLLPVPHSINPRR